MRGLSSAAAALFAASASLAAASTIVYDFNVTWVIANPDGAFPRPVIGINNQWPIPRIEAEINDQIIVNVNNQLGNQSTSLHFHGLFQNGTSYNDGPVGVSQCGIPPGASFTYNFTIQQTGTYWYHSHVNTQYPDGLRGPLIITDPNSPYKDQVDEELILTLSDWYHGQVADILPAFINKADPTGAEPIPDAALMNETQNYTISVKPNTTYLFRVINIGAFANMYLWIEGHTMQIVEVDGVYTETAETDMVLIAVAQRVSFLVTTKNDTSANFPIVASMDTTLFDVVPPNLNWNVTGWLTYDSAAPLPAPQIIAEFDPIDDMSLVPYDHQPLLPEPDQIIELDVIMADLGNGANYAFFNNITYVSPKVPSLYTALSSGDLANDSTVYGTYTHPFILQKDQVVQIVVNNLDTGRHPFHLHGHQFQAIYRAPENAGTFESLNVSESSLPQVPMRRDTLIAWPGGNIVLRFKADNPGVWLFHCHIEWHVATGLIATMIEAPLAIQEQYSSAPADQVAVCALGGHPSAGNAAGNTIDLLDLTGQPSPPAPLPAGFTPRGIVALVFSCISGILGIAVVAWYGLSLPVEAVPTGFARMIAETGDSPEADSGVLVEEVKGAAVAATTTGASSRLEH